MAKVLVSGGLAVIIFLPVQTHILYIVGHFYKVLSKVLKLLSKVHILLVPWTSLSTFFMGSD